MENALSTENIRKSFKLNKRQMAAKKLSEPTLVAVNGLNITLRPGEIYGLLGPNGAGKTTALRMIASLIKPEDGKILYGGEDVYKDLNAYRKKVAFLTSELKLDDFFTPSYTFTYMARLYGLEESEIENRKASLFEKFGVNEFAESKISELSTGMKQKASLAISLCHDPDIIIFDEPTNGLDIIASSDVESFLLDLKKEGKIILLSTHIFSLVEKLCDRVGIILDGKLRLEGELKELCQGKNLEQLFFETYNGGERQ
ncbi:MAG: ABC transporter ATP-binding protein [Bacillota bacterium]|nr:ABC transporter ATP-binding protein [Bacillota bacterium]